MKNIQIPALLIAVLFNFSCLKINTPGGLVVWGSGETVTITPEYENFNEIVVSDKFNVNIQQGDRYEVEIKTNKNMQEFLAINQKYTVLDIQMKPNRFYKDAVLEAEITLPDLVYLDVNGISRVTIDEFAVKKDIRIDITETSKLTANIRAEGVFLTVKNSSEAEFHGSAGYLKAEGVLSSQLNMRDLATQRANIYLSIGSEGEFNISDRFVAELRGGATMKYKGNAEEEKIVKDDSSILEKLSDSD